MILQYYLFPTFFFFFLLKSSVLTFLFLCKLYNKSFINNVKYQINKTTYIQEKAKSIVESTSLLVITYNAVYFGFAQHYLQQPLGYYISIFKCIHYILWIEFLFYGYHRLSHTRFLYKISHSYHHKNIFVYPIDAFDIELGDSTGLLVFLNIPLYFVRLNYYEYAFLHYLYTLGSIATHSEMVVTYHSIHHRLLRYNYCFLFPIYDFVFGTLKIQK